MVSPVMVSLLSRVMSNSAISSAEDSRPRGAFAMMSLRHSSSVISDGRMVGPGARALTRMPWGANSAAKARVMNCTAAFAVR